MRDYMMKENIIKNILNKKLNDENLLEKKTPI